MRAALDALAGIGRRAAPAARSPCSARCTSSATSAAAEHERGRAAPRPRRASTLVVVGEAAARGIADGAAGRSRMARRGGRTAGRDEALAWLRENVAAGDVVLVKARGARRWSRSRDATGDSTSRHGERRTDESDPARRWPGAADLPARHPRARSRCSPTQGYGQEIRDDGPTSHHTKRGTPTMGGVVIILATVARLLRRQADHPGPAVGVRAAAALPLRRAAAWSASSTTSSRSSKQRSLGLRSKAKMIGQTVVAVVFGILALSPCARGRPRRDPGVAAHLVHPRLRRLRRCRRRRDRADLADHHRHQQRREPHRRPRRPGHRRVA